MTVSDNLNRAADIMIERGHCKRNYRDRDGRVCLLGAVYTALYGDATIDADVAVTLHLSDEVRYLGERAWPLKPHQWNDRDETTEAMAIGFLHEAALAAKENGE